MKPPIILVGYPGSQKIVAASKYLTSKYLPDFNITYLNYKGEINGWGEYVTAFLEYLTDDEVVFALDDYLVAEGIDMIRFCAAQQLLKGDVVCVKLCESTEQEHLEYPVTTQYCIWNKQYLIWLLKKINTPWEFEINGSRIFNTVEFFETKVRSTNFPCLKYFTNSSISSRWEGVRLDGLKQEDIDYIIENKLIHE